ncbi:MAG: hypothetical protein ACE5KZ_01040 [Candidatus Scalinduaceae bacterium]
MKLKEKTQSEHSIIYVPEHFGSKSISGPSSAFMETVKEIKALNFVGKSTDEFINVCKLNIRKSPS